MPQSAAAFLDAPSGTPPSAAAFLDDAPASTTASGLAASTARGAAPYAEGALLGAGIGSVVPGIGTALGAGTGIAATALTQFGGDVYNWLGAPFGHFLTPQEASDKALDALGIKRPQTTAENAAESGASFAASMAGVPLAPHVAASAPASAALLRDFEAHAVSPSVPTVGQGRVAALVTGLGRSLPISAPIVRNAITKSLSETATAIRRGASLFGQAGDAETTGAGVRNAVRRFAEDQSAAERNYGRFWGLMGNAAPAAMPNTGKLVNELMGQYPNAPELEGWATQAPIARLREALRTKRITTPAETSRVLDEYGHPAIVREATTTERGGKLSMAEIRQLRAQVGRLIGQPARGPEAIPKAELRRLYGALTDDMRAVAKARGPAALQALEHANAEYGIRMRLLDAVRSLADTDNAAQAFKKLNSAATSGTSNAGLLRAAKKVLSPDEWGDLGATVVARLGEPTPGTKDVLADTNFSPSTFVTNWNKLSDKAKDLLFGPDTAGSPRAGLEALTRIAQAQKNVANLSNWSHTAEYWTTAAGSWELLNAAYQAVAHGDLSQAGIIGAAAAGGYGLAKLMMSPRVARWIYALPRIRALSPAAQMQIGMNAFVAAMSAPLSRVMP